MEDIDVLSANLEMVCNGVGGFVVGKYSVIDRQRLFGEGYINISNNININNANINNNTSNINLNNINSNI